MLRLRYIMVVAFGAAWLHAAELSAQRPATRRPVRRSNTLNTVLGVNLDGSTLAYSGEGAEFGIGAGVMAGFGFSRRIMLFGEYDAARIDINASDTPGTYTLASGDIGLRYSFANVYKAVIPYLSLAANVRQASSQVAGLGGTADLSITGPGFTLGGGAQYFMTQKWALDFGLRYARGTLGRQNIGGSHQQVRNATNSTSTRFVFGLRFYPQLPEPD